MNSPQEVTSNDSLQNIQADLYFDKQFSYAMADLWDLHRNYIAHSLPNNEVYESIIKHIEHFTNRYFNQPDYKSCNRDQLENQDWHPINDRYGLKSILGSINELYVMTFLLSDGYTVLPIIDKEQQTVGELDFIINKPNWKQPVTCQSKSVLNADPWGKFTREKDTWVGWSKIKASRIYISDHTNTLWCDTLLFRGMLEEYDFLIDEKSSTSLLMLYNLLQLQYPSFDRFQFGTFRKELQ